MMILRQGSCGPGGREQNERVPNWKAVSGKPGGAGFVCVSSAGHVAAKPLG